MKLQTTKLCAWYNTTIIPIMFHAVLKARTFLFATAFMKNVSFVRFSGTKKRYSFKH